MAASVSTIPGIKVITLGGIDIATRVDLPNRCRRVRVRFITNSGKVAVSGTDAAAVVADHWPVAADTDWNIMVDRDAHEAGLGPSSVYLASPVAGTVVHVLAEAG